MAMQQPINMTLTKVGLKYVQDPSTFVAGNIFPQCPVNLLSASFPTYPKEYWMKNEAAVRAPGTESEGGTHKRGLDTYTCEDVSFHEDVPFENIKNDPAPLNPEKAATRRVILKIAIKDEVDFAGDYMVTGTWGTDKTVVIGWGTPGTAIPLNDVSVARAAVKVATGYDPNTLVLSRTAFDALTFCEQITDRLKYTTSENITEGILARLFNVSRVIVCNTVYDSAKYGAAAVQAFVMGDSALLLHTASSPSLEEASAGYNFTWNGYGLKGFGVRRYWREDPMAYRVEAHHYHDMKLMAADLGYFFNGPVAGGG
jgi:hypothetical protein